MVNVIILAIVFAIELLVGVELLRINIIRIRSTLWKRIKLHFDDNNTFPLTRAMRLFGRKRMVAKLSILSFTATLGFIVFDEIANLSLFDSYIYLSIYFSIVSLILLGIYVVLKFIPYVWRYFMQRILRRPPREDNTVEYHNNRNFIWKFFKVGFIFLTFLPASVIRSEFLGSDLQGILFANGGWQQYIHYIFPNEILGEIYDFGLPVWMEKIAFVVLLALLGTILAIFIDKNKSQQFMLREFEFYDEPMILQVNAGEKKVVYGEWKQPQHSETLDDGILLLHGFGANYYTWSDDDKDLNNSNNIFSQLSGKNKRVFSIGFTDTLRSGLNTEFKLKRPRTDLILPTEINDLRMNNYSWELLLSMMYIKQLCKIRSLHIISHSTGGLVIRDLYRRITDGVGEQVAMRKGIYSDEPDSHVSFASKITYLAAPHRGARGTSNIFIYFFHSFPRYIRWILAIFSAPLRIMGWLIDIFTKTRPKFILNWIDMLGTYLVAFISDGETPIDLNPKSTYLRHLNRYDPVRKRDCITFYPFIEWQNASGRYDGVVGSGSIELPRDLDNPGITVGTALFPVDHAGQAFEDWMQRPRSYVAIMYSKEVWDWVL